MTDELEAANTGDVSWKKAKALAAPVLPIPSLFSTAVRGINRVADEARGLDQATIRNAACDKAAFLIGVSPTLKSVFYFAAKAMYPEALLNIKSLDTKSLMLLFSAEEMAAILSLTYMSKKIMKKSDPQEWKVIAPIMQLHMRIGQIIGETIEHIGSGNGLLIGGMRYLALSLYGLDDLKSFQKYRRRCDKEGKLFNLAEEQELWGCNHMQVASVLVQALGFGSPRHAAATCFGLDSMNIRIDALPGHMQEQAVCWQAAFACTESYHLTGEAPKLSAEGMMFLPEEEAANLVRKVRAAKSERGCGEWILSKRQNLSADMADKLGIVTEEHESKEDSAVFEHTAAPSKSEDSTS